MQLANMYGPPKGRPKDGDITGSFSCRKAVPSPCNGNVSGMHWSNHAYGLALDLNPVENPYVGCGMTRHRTAISYLDRSNVRKGMVTPAIIRASRRRPGLGRLLDGGYEGLHALLLQRALRKLALLVALLIAAATAGAASLPSQSDEFADPATTAQWQVMQGDLADGVALAFDIAKTTPGELTITPGRSWWVDGTRAFYLYKPIAGDFIVTARLHVTGREATVPAADWSLSGLLVRRPTDNRAQENWVSFRIGPRGQGRVRAEDDRRRTSTLVLTPAQPTWVELRIARVGRYFVLLRRYGSGPFTTHFTYIRRDLPPALTVGIDAFTGYGDTRPTSSSHVDWIHFSSTGVPGPLRRAVLAGKRPPAALVRYLNR